MAHWVLAGRLREVISIQRFITVQSSFGEPVKTWSTQSSNVRAAIRPIRMTENFQDDQFIGKETKTFFLRYTTRINEKDRIVFKSQNYNVESVINSDERNHRLEVICTKVNPGA